MNEIMNVENTGISIMDERVKPYVSFTPDSPEDKIKLYNAMNSPQYRLKQMINKPLIMKDAVLIPCRLTSEETGEPSDAVRAIIIDDKGATYSAVATGVITSLRNLLAVFGTLHFEQGLKVTVKEVPVKRGNTLTLEIA